jgi:hypothetical protein
MSYSYIKSVFPNFENSNKVYDETLYNNINTLYTDKESSIPIPGNLESQVYNKQKDEFVLTKETLLENPKIEKMSNINVNTNGQSSLPFQYTQTPLQELSEISFNKQSEQNNLSYYNLPIKDSLFSIGHKEPTDLKEQVVNKIEKFEDVKDKKTCSEPECDLYVKHILECNKCKSVAMKQLGIESDKVRNEEIMEVVSYIVFGLFILLLIDSLKSDKK